MEVEILTTVHAVAARSKTSSQNVQMTKHTILGRLLEVEMLKKCAPLCREAHLEVKMYEYVQNTSALKHF